jgi:hypothetical protein
MKKISDFLLSDKVYMIFILLYTAYSVYKEKYPFAVILFGLFIIIALKIYNKDEKKID